MNAHDRGVTTMLNGRLVHRGHEREPYARRCDTMKSSAGWCIPRGGGAGRRRVIAAALLRKLGLIDLEAE
jgi:hypothetical protein